MSSKVELTNSGGLITASSPRDALLATLFNKPTRGKRCPIILACFDVEASSDFKHHRRNDLLALVDAQGEIYCMSMAENDYFSVRFVPQPISSVCFVPYSRYCLIVAYENTGMVVLFNLKTKSVMGNLQMPREILGKSRRNNTGPSAVRLISCHAKLPLAVMVSDNTTVTLWDLKKYRCIHTLQCDEAIVDVRFELGGDAIAVTRLTSGVYLYAVIDRRLLMHLTLPESERKPQWTAYCSHKNKASSSPAFSVASESNSNKEFSVLVAGNNSMLYSWLISASRVHQTQRTARGDAGERIIKSDQTSVLVPTSGRLVAIVELPVNVNTVIKMTPLHGHINPTRICMLCDTGDVLLVAVSNLSSSSMGTYTVLAEISGVNNDPSRVLAPLGPQFKPVQIGMTTQLNSQDSCLGKLDSCDGYLVCVDKEGSARLFDGDKFIDSNKDKATQLRCRRPFGTNGRNDVRQEVTSSRSRTNNSTLTSDVPPVLDDTFVDEDDEELLSTIIQTNSRGTNRFVDSSDANKTRGVHQGVSSLHHSKQESGRSISRTQQSYSVRSGSTIGSNGVHRAKGHASLFELAALTPKEQRVNEEKLKKFLHAHGEFPSRYRPLIWRFLMKLPENTVAFSELASRGVHAAFEDLHDKYPLQSKRIFTRLQATCSQIAHWAPILAEAPYLPSLVFPFLLVFGRDELSIFEMVMSIMIWWGHSWHVTHPNPPLHILDCCDGLLKFHDPRLYQHFSALEVSVGVVCWSMISSFFSEVLNRTDWLALVDFIVTNFERIELMLCIPVAIITQLKGSLLTGQTADQLINFCRSQQGGIRVKDCIKKSLELLRNTPPKYFAATTTQLLDGLHAQNVNGIRKPSSAGMDEKEIANINLALHGGRPLFPLSKVKYPIYDGYPKQIIDLQLKERSKVLAMERELMRRESSLQQLQAKVKGADDEHNAWMQAHARGSEADAKYRKEIMEKEKQYLIQLQYIEEETSKQRLLALESMEAAAREEILLMDTVAKTSHQMLMETEKHLREKMEISLAVQKHRELSAEAELRMEERIRKLRLRRSRDDWVASMSESLRQKEEEYTTRDSLLTEQWQSEDVQQRLQKQIRDEQRSRFEEEDRLNRMQEEINDKLQRLELERATKLKEIERQRSVRAAKEQAAEALEAASRSQQILRTSQARLSAEGRATELAERGTQLLDSRLADTLHHISEESNRLLEMERVHLQRQQSLLQQATDFKYRRQWADKAEQQAKFVMAAESDLQRQLLVLQRAAMKTETEMLKQLQEQPLGAPVGKQESNFEELGERVLRQQRERFREMQQFFEKQQQKLQQDYLKQPKQQHHHHQRTSSSGESSGGMPARLMTLSPAISVRSEKSSSSASSDLTQEWARPRQQPLDLDEHKPVQSFPDVYDEVKFVSSTSDDNTFSSSKGSSPDLPIDDAIQSANKVFLNHSIENESTGSSSDLGQIPATTAQSTNRYTTQKTFSKQTSSQSTQISKATSGALLSNLVDRAIRNVQESRTFNREEKAMEEEREELGQQFSYKLDSTSEFREGNRRVDRYDESNKNYNKQSTGIYSVWMRNGADNNEGAMAAAAAAAAASLGGVINQDERSIDNDSALWAFEESSSEDDSTS